MPKKLTSNRVSVQRSQSQVLTRVEYRISSRVQSLLLHLRTLVSAGIKHGYIPSYRERRQSMHNVQVLHV